MEPSIVGLCTSRRVSANHTVLTVLTLIKRVGITRARVSGSDKVVAEHDRPVKQVDL